MAILPLRLSLQLVDGPTPQNPNCMIIGDQPGAKDGSRMDDLNPVFTMTEQQTSGEKSETCKRFGKFLPFKGIEPPL